MKSLALDPALNAFPVLAIPVSLLIAFNVPGIILSILAALANLPVIPAIPLEGSKRAKVLPILTALSAHQAKSPTSQLFDGFSL